MRHRGGSLTARKYSRQEENTAGTSKRKTRSSEQPGTKDGTSLPQGDVAELARILASLTPEERAALLATLRSSASVSVSETRSQADSGGLC